MKRSSKRRTKASVAPTEFLQLLAERLRTMRNRRGISRKVLARQSDISERYLAQLEAGEANYSIVLLRRIAKAIGVHLIDLVDDRPERQLEAVLLEQFVGRLSPRSFPKRATCWFAILKARQAPGAKSGLLSSACAAPESPPSGNCSRAG